MPMPSWTTLTIGARQLVVQDAAVTMRCRRRVVAVMVDAEHDVEHTAGLDRRGNDHAFCATLEMPRERFGRQELAGAFKTTSTPTSPHGISPGDAHGGKRESRSPIRIARRPRPRCAPPAALNAVELKQMRRGARAAFQFVDVHHVDPIAAARIVRRALGAAHAARSASRPIRPNPLIPTFIFRSRYVSIVIFPIISNYRK